MATGKRRGRPRRAATMASASVLVVAVVLAGCTDGKTHGPKASSASGVELTAPAAASVSAAPQVA